MQGETTRPPHGMSALSRFATSLLLEYTGEGQFDVLAAPAADIRLPLCHAGRWRINPITRQPELLNSPAQQLLSVLSHQPS
jgi:hypothetical protein